MKVFNTAMLIVGTIIGAGFATGAEIVTFFGASALPAGLIAVLIFITLFALLSAIVFLSDKNVKIGNFKITKAVFLILYFMFFVAMTAGMSEAGIVACMISLAISGAVVFLGIDIMTKFNTAAVVAIIVILLTVCLPYIGADIPKFGINFGMLGGTAFSAILYAGLNCCMSDKIITAQTGKMSKKSLYFSVLIAAVIIAVFAYLILNAVRANDAAAAVMPLLSISNNSVTFAVILLAILTSQYSALFVLTAATNNRPVTIIGLCAAAFCFSFFGFVKVVGIFYPIIGGIVSLFLLVSICSFWLHNLRH